MFGIYVIPTLYRQKVCYYYLYGFSTIAWGGGAKIGQSRYWLGYGLDDSGVWIPAGARDFSFLQNVKTDSGVRPLSLLCNE